MGWGWGVLMSFPARYTSVCFNCNRTILLGELIWPVSGKRTKTRTLYAHEKCPCQECGHAWEQHTATANGARACKHFGCGCRDVLEPQLELPLTPETK